MLGCKCLLFFFFFRLFCTLRTGYWEWVIRWRSTITKEDGVILCRKTSTIRKRLGCCYRFLIICRVCMSTTYIDILLMAQQKIFVLLCVSSNIYIYQSYLYLQYRVKLICSGWSHKNNADDRTSKKKKRREEDATTAKAKH